MATAGQRQVVAVACAEPGCSALLLWAERAGRRRTTGPARGGLRFAFYGRVSTEDWQDPVTSQARQREQAAALTAGHGQIAAEFFDIGQSRSVAWGRRPQAAALVAALADPDPDRGWGWDAGIPCPSAADPDRNRHRTGTAWTLGAVTTILQNPRYTGRQVWNRQRTDKDLADPADIALGHKSVQRWNLPDGWVISGKPAHESLVSEADFIAAQDVSAARGPAPEVGPAVPQKRRYLLAGLLACGTCGRRMESAWSHGKAAYRCRHGHTSAAPPDPGRPGNAYVREDRILPRLPALHLLLAGAEPAEARRRRRTRGGTDARSAASPEEAIGYLREHAITLTYDPAAGTLQGRRGTGRQDHHQESKLTQGSEPRTGRRRKENRRSPGAGGTRARVTIRRARKRAAVGF